MSTAACPACGAPMSKIDPTRCQNCDFQTGWTPEELALYREVLTAYREAVEVLATPAKSKER